MMVLMGQVSSFLKVKCFFPSLRVYSLVGLWFLLQVEEDNGDLNSK